MANNSGKPQSQQRAPASAQRRESAAQTTPAPEVVAPVEPVKAVEEKDDTVVMAAAPAPAPEPAPAPAAKPVAEESQAMKSLIVTDQDDEHVVALKQTLSDFVKVAAKHGTEPEDFKSQAKMALMITKFVTQHPKVDVLDTLANFFEENITGVCDSKTFLKGTTTLSMADERQVGFLHGLFADLARKQNVRINSGMVTQVFNKPEIANYYARRTAAFVNAS